MGGNNETIIITENYKDIFYMHIAVTMIGLSDLIKSLLNVKIEKLEVVHRRPKMPS